MKVGEERVEGNGINVGNFNFFGREFCNFLVMFVIVFVRNDGIYVRDL